jgi:REP element-mobilizing transposase RayT
MPRKPRHIVKGAVYHLISRFVDREWFITTRGERELYLRMLGRALLDTDWRCLAYAVMSNHIHLQAVAGSNSLASWIRRVHSPFADTMNQAHGRIGSMFVRGPKACFVPPDKVARVLAYIHNNPVRAQVVAEPRDSEWTSHRAYVGLARSPRWLHVEEGLQRAGMTAEVFEEWVHTRHVEAAPKTDAELFDALELEEAVEVEVAPMVGADELVRITADEVGLSVAAIRSRRKQAHHVLARRVVALCGDHIGLSGVAIARSLGASQQCVSKILTQGCVDGPQRAVIDRVLLAVNRAG